MLTSALEDYVLKDVGRLQLCAASLWDAAFLKASKNLSITWRLPSQFSGLTPEGVELVLTVWIQHQTKRHSYTNLFDGQVVWRGVVDARPHHDQRRRWTTASEQGGSGRPAQCCQHPVRAAPQRSLQVQPAPAHRSALAWQMGLIFAGTQLAAGPCYCHTTHTT